jgi:hypothetical protein
VRPLPAPPRHGAFEAGRRAGYADRHSTLPDEYRGWTGSEWREWFRGWREGQREARERADRGEREPMRYRPLYPPKKAALSEWRLRGREVAVR